MDMTTRALAAVMTESIGQSVVVENRTGGGGMIGADYAARAAPDGHTLLMYADANAISPAIYRKLNHDPINDFAPITNTILGTHIIVGHPSVQANTLKELIELAKKPGSKLSFGSPGTGTPQHLAGELFKQQAGKLDIVHVPYRGGGQLIGDLLAGQVPLGLIGLPPTLPHIKAGKLKVFAVTARTRSSSLPDVPTVEEAGLPGYETIQWFGPVAPAGTPKPVIDRLYAEFVKALKHPAVVERLGKAGLEIAPSASPEAYGEFIRKEAARWPAIVKAAGVEPQ
jgi:tripartite-type tricarboxylate transporter receptor subunit TctC